MNFYYQQSFITRILVAFLITSTTLASSGGEDFYELLGVSRDADDRSIRRAFKKLAIQLHPDKNQGDPSAHDKFVRINRAYEILKDDELRKKYDQFGEEGLKEGAGRQPQYQSWQFYKEQFGIYDDDSEISTLNGHDFDALVINGRRRWFVNFYSAHCSHCHELAPAWRQFARQVESVISVGAVNCLDEYFLCQQQQIGYFPMLVMYPERERYDGPKDVDSLLDFVLSKLQSVVVKFTEENFARIVSAHKDRPWLVDMCNEKSELSAMDCLSWKNRKLIAAALNLAVNVGSISCDVEEDLCEKLGSPGLFYFRDGALGEAAGDRIQSLDAKEIVSIIWSKMPPFMELEEANMKEMAKTGKFGEESVPWLVYFTEHGSSDNMEYRLLPSLLLGLEIKIGQFNCSKYAMVCRELNLNTFPAFIIFKPGLGYEIHYGKLSLHDIAAFAQDCAYTNVRTLSASDFFDIVAESDATKPWFIDFFAPWCPPCMRLLPEFRKAARILGENGQSIRFGTMDCTVNGHACQSASVYSYPTTVLYNGTKVDSFVGLHNMQELLDFIEDIKNPPVIALTSDLFQDRVLNRKDDEIWLIDFYSPNCPPCQQLAPELRKLAKLFVEFPSVFIADLDCSKFGHLCQQQYIPMYPTIRVFPRNRGAPMDYSSWFRDVMSLRTWLFAFLPSRVSDLTGDDFYAIMESKEPWLVDFFAPWCGHCQTFAPEFEKVAEALEGRVRCGKINCDLYMQACQAAIVRAYPSVRFYIGVSGNSVDSQSAFGTEIGSQDSRQIVAYTESLLSQYKKENPALERDEL